MGSGVINRTSTIGGSSNFKLHIPSSMQSGLATNRANAFHMVDEGDLKSEPRQGTHYVELSDSAGGTISN